MVKNDSFFLWTDAQSWHNTEKFFEDTKKRTESEKQLSGKRKDEKMEEVMILAEKRTDGHRRSLQKNSE